jgi:hypothetical protein
MQSPNLNSLMQSDAAVCLVGDSVGNLCPWCNAALKSSKTKPRKYCTEAHEKAFKRAGCKSKNKCEEEGQWVIDYYLAHFNRGHAFSTFGRHDPMTELPTYSLKKIKDKVLEHAGSYRPALDLHGEGQTATTPRKVTHEVNENDRPEVPEPTPTITGWERGDVVLLSPKQGRSINGDGSPRMSGTKTKTKLRRRMDYLPRPRNK